MQLKLQDVLNQTKDEVGNYSTGIIQDERIIRAINRSMEYLKRRLGFPSDEKVFSFLYSADQMFYDLDEDFDESVLLCYKDNAYNRPSREWSYFTYPEVLRQVGSSPDFLYSVTTMNGRKQLVVVGHNVRNGTTIDTMDSFSGWSAGGDASNLRLDTYKKYSGDGSLQFDITHNTGIAYLEKTVSLTLKDLFLNDGFLKFWTYLTDDNLEDIAIKLYTTPTSYYTITADTTDDGSPFSIDEFLKIGWNVNDAIATGTPDPNNITKIRIEWDIPSDFGSATDFRANMLFDSFPDEMKLVYYSSYKGTDSTGATNKIILDTVSDIVAIGDYFPDYIGLIAERAAIQMWNQLKGDKTAYSMLVSKFNDDMKTWGRVYPRKRSMINTYSTKLRR
jgi:hypothetical protein